MIIKKITLKNYRLYKGENEILFPEKDNKNIFLISGENGFGKTTFLHSLLWCLYGRLMINVDETLKRDISKGGYNRFLEANLNIESKTNLNSYSDELLGAIRTDGYSSVTEQVKMYSQYSVSIHFSQVSIPSIPCNSLTVTRTYDIILEKEFVEIYIDESQNELIEEMGPDLFINDFILNIDIARFFFFDSERIVSLAETNTMDEKRKLNSAYNEVLGVKKYDDLKTNLENVRLRLRQKSDDIGKKKELEDLLDQEYKLQNKADDYDKKIEEINNQLISLRIENESLQSKLLREGSNITLEELKRLQELLAFAKEKDAVYKTRLKDLLRYAPFAIAGNSFLKAKLQLDNDFNIIQSNKNVLSQNKLISQLASDLFRNIEHLELNVDKKQEINSSLKKILSKYEGVKINDKPLLDIDKNFYDEFIAVFSYITSTYSAEFERLADDYRKNRSVVDRTSRRISKMQNLENDLVIKSIRSKKNIVENQITKLTDSLRFLHEKKGVINDEILKLKRLIPVISNNINLVSDNLQKDEVAKQLITELDTFLISLKKRKKISLERRIKETMNLLMHKKDFIGSVNVNVINDTIDIDLYSSDNNLIRKDTLSKGEQQLYATSILKSLVDESGIQFPVFIDSPLQKFDKRHSSKIITDFYPSISKQVVLFPLLYKELIPSEFELMKPHVNSIYLIQNEDVHSFFEKVGINDIMSNRN